MPDQRPTYPTFEDVRLRVLGAPANPQILSCYCNLCGLLVGNRDLHREWHDQQKGAADD